MSGGFSLENKPKILLIDDEESILKVISTILKNEGFSVITAKNKKEAVNKLKNINFDIVLSDFKLPDGTGIEILQEFKKENPLTPFIIITAYGSINGAVEAMQKGATHYISKPIDSSQLIETINFHLQKASFTNEIKEFEGIIGKSSKMKELFKEISIVSKSSSTVLIEGESGTGKELVAKAIHKLSNRKDKPFIPINCSAIPLELFENELFGHEKGAYTGAGSKTLGKIEIAGEGTLFLDEIGEMPQLIQAKLLRVLQEKEFFRIGGTELVQVKCRIISATNRNIEKMVEDGEFREDLFYRINVVHLRIPPLRERKEDIPLLVKQFLKKYSKENNKEVVDIDSSVLEIFLKYDWPGNVRELENAIERAVVMCPIDKIKIEHIPKRIINKLSSKSNSDTFSDKTYNLTEIERKIILSALEEENWNQTKTAQKLGISRKQLRTKMKNLGLLS
jgi:DNA-binding NtrC family response regulator